MSLLYQAPVITRSSALDNQSEDDHELLTITSLASSSVYPTYVKIISDNITTNSLSQKLFPLKNDDYVLNGSTYSINVLFDVRANQQYTLKAKVVYSDGNFTAFSSMFVFTSSPTTPQILCAFGTSQTSIFLRINPQSEVQTYTAILTYLDYNSDKQLDVVEDLYASGEGRFIEIPNLLLNVEYLISIQANNIHGQSYLSNSVSSTTKPQPLIPTDLQVEFDTDAYVSLEWSAPENSDLLPLENYIIQDGSGNELVTIAGDVLSYTFPMPFDLNQNYTFQIVAVNISNGTSYLSSPSDSQSIFIPEPSEVQNLSSSTDPSTLVISLSWSAPANSNVISANSYNVILNGQLLINTTSTSATYTSSPNSTNSFDVVPLHGSYTSGQSSSLNVQIPSSGSPRSLNGTFDSSGSIVLTWLAPSNIGQITTDSYNVYSGNSTSFTFLSNTTNLTYTVSSQIPGGSFSFFVKSVHGSIEGNASMVFNISLPLPNAPVNVSSSFDLTGSITVKWAPSSTSPIDVSSFQVYDSANNLLNTILANMSDPNVYDTNTQLFFSPISNSQSLYPIGSTYSFYVVALANTVPSQPSSSTSITLPVPTNPLNPSGIVSPTTPPTVSLSWDPPANRNIISTDSYNVYQDNILVHNVIQPSYNSGNLNPGQEYVYTIYPVHNSVEYNNPSLFRIIPYQAATAPINFVASPKNQSIILSWEDPTNIGGGNKTKYVLSYGSTTLDISISPGSYSQTITGLTNKTSYNFTLYLITNSTVIGASATLTAVPTGLPIINSVSLTNGVLSAFVDSNGSSLVENFTVISYNSSNVPTVQSFNTPPDVNGIVTISQSIGVGNKATLVVANTLGLSSATTN